MTTTGDLFVNIKGNNQGLKKSLNQSSRDISTFSKQAERNMKSGLGAADILGIGAISNAQTLIKGMQAMNTRRKQSRHDIPGLMREISLEGRPNRQFIGPLPREEHLRHRNNQQFIDSTRARRKRINAEQKAVNPMLRALFTAPAFAAGVAGVAGLVIASNGTKWAKRINESAMSYSGAAIGNQARIDAANMRKDIQLARQNAGSAIFRQNAADFRKNSGAGGNVANTIGGAYDAAVGLASNAVFGIPGLIMNYKQVTDTIGGPK